MATFNFSANRSKNVTIDRHAIRCGIADAEALIVGSGSATRILAPGVDASGGVDVTATHLGKHVAYRAFGTSSILVATTLDEGTSWSVAMLAADAGEGSVPTIAADHRDNLFCAYHNDADQTRIHLSTDYGATWALWKTISGACWPRMRFGGEGSAQGAGQDRAALALWSLADEEIHVFLSEDSLATLPAAALSLAVQEQLVDLAVDRRGAFRIFYADGASLYRRYSADGDTWEAPALLRSVGTHPAFAHYYPFGIFLWFEDDVLYGQPTTSDYQGLVGSPIPITASITPQYLGLCTDRRDNPWVFWIYVPDPAPEPPDYPTIYFAPGLQVNVPGDAPGRFTFDDPGMMGFLDPIITDTSPQFDAIDTSP